MEHILAILPQVTIDGLMLGFVYAVVAIGYTMVYGVLEFINFSHSEIFMFGAFAGTEVLLLLEATGLLGRVPDVLALVMAVMVAMVVSGLLGVTIERVAYRPLRRAPRLVPLITAIGVSFILQDLARFIWQATRGTFVLSAPKILPAVVQLGGGATVSLRALINMGISLLMMAALTVFVRRSRAGKAMRAVAQDQATASLMGVNVNRTISLTFLIGAALGGAAGALFAIQYTRTDPYIGFVLGMKAFTAAVFGGIGSLPGAMLGGVLLGLFEAYGSAFLSTATNGVFGAAYKDVFAFLILIVVLIFKPAGLLGLSTTEKV